MTSREAASWDAEYRVGRYADEPPVDFVGDILAAAESLPAGARGLYVGCGNGRNYLPLVAAGLDLTGLDISAVALADLARRAPERAEHLVHGSLDDLPEGDRYDLVVGIQVFQHGDGAAARAHLSAALRRVAPGGLFCLRVNAVGTDVHPGHEVVEGNTDDGFTVRYLEGGKAGLLIHFFARAELDALIPDRDFTPVLAPRIHRTHRRPPAPGQWSQWEAVYRRRQPPTDPELRQLDAGHAAAVLAFERENRAYFAASITDRGDAFFDRFTDVFAAALAEQETGVCAFYLLVAEDGSVVGRFNLYDLADGTARLGYRVAERAAGRGTATAAVRELCRTAAAAHGLHTLWAAVSDDNAASRKVLAKSGFTPIGPAAPSELGGKAGTWYERDLRP